MDSINDDSEVMIALGDEIFTNPYFQMILPFRSLVDITGAIGIKTVKDSTHYGMVKIGPNNCITYMVEKPEKFSEKTAIAGVYYLKHGRDLIASLEMIMNNQGSDLELQLTDALQIMIKTDSKLLAFDVGDWYDCGRPETLIESNRRLLEKNHYVSPSCRIVNSEIIEPCYLGPNSFVSNSRVGPYVSLGRNVKIENSSIIDLIIESNTVANSISLEGGIVSRNDALVNHTSESEWKFLKI